MYVPSSVSFTSSTINQYVPVRIELPVVLASKSYATTAMKTNEVLPPNPSLNQEQQQQKNHRIIYAKIFTLFPVTLKFLLCLIEMTFALTFSYGRNFVHEYIWYVHLQKRRFVVDWILTVDHGFHWWEKLTKLRYYWITSWKLENWLQECLCQSRIFVLLPLYVGLGVRLGIYDPVFA